MELQFENITEITKYGLIHFLFHTTLISFFHTDDLWYLAYGKNIWKVQAPNFAKPDLLSDEL